MLDSFLAAVEDVLEDALDGGHGLRRGVDRNGALLPEIERAHVVQAHDVVGVGVGEEHRIQMVDARAQRLSAEIRRGVDEHVAPLVAHQDRGASPDSRREIGFRF